MQVPDVKGQVSADAVGHAAESRVPDQHLQKPDSVVPPDHVIGTDPAANTSVKAGGRSR